jgi:hypothetical protein
MRRPSAIDIFVADAMCRVADSLAKYPTPARRARLLTHVCAGLDEQLLHPPATRRRDNQLALERVRRLCGDMLRQQQEAVAGEAA